MSRNKLKRYTGAEVAQPKSIAEQLLAGTRIGNLLYGKQKTYKDGNNQERKDASFKESANGQLVQRMGETAKDTGGLVATGLAFGNPLTASNAMAPIIAGSQAYWIGHGINDGTQRIDNIGEGVQNFVEAPSWQNAGAVAKEVPMLALDVASALPVAKTVIETGKNAIPAAQQAAQRIVGSVDDAITTATKQAVESGVVGVNELPAQLAAKATSTPRVQDPLWNVGWAPAQTMDIRRAGELTEMYYPNRWDVVEEGANSFGVWLQGKFGTPRTNITNPGKGERAAKARELFANRPQYVGNVTFKKPIEVIGDVKDRSALSYNAERMGADGVIYNGFYDNGYNNNQGIFSFVKPNLSPSSGQPARIMWMGPTTGKTTYAKKDLSVVDIDPLTKGTRKEVAKKLGLDFRDPKVSESPEYQQAIVDMVNTWLKDPTNHGKTLVASTKHLLDPKYGIKFANEPFMPDFETFVTRNQARGFRETPEQLREWYNSILKIKPNIKIDNRFASEILNPSFKSETALVSANGKMVPRWQLPKGQRNQSHNPTATERIYSVLGRDPNVPTGGVRDFTASRFVENQLQPLYKFLQQHGVDTKNITLSDLENLYGRRFNAIKSASHNNYNLAVPQGTEALPRQWEIRAFDPEGLVGEMMITGPTRKHPDMLPEIWEKYQRFRPGSSVDMVRNATRADGASMYHPKYGWYATEIPTRTPVSGVSQRMYDAGIPVVQQTNNGRGLMSGEMYLQPQRSTAVMKHYPTKQIIRNNGEWHWENLDPTKVTTRDNPVYLLTQPSGRYTHIPTKSSLFFPSAIKDGQITTNVNHGSIFLEDGGKL